MESEIKAKLVTALNNNYKDDTITNSNSNAWNYMFMTVSEKNMSSHMINIFFKMLFTYADQ